MNKRYFTIGMAGHIDHGKTTLTKALTNVDTDRLKEEKERNISIELGFAPLYEDDEIQISVVDVPGHERFIRQMIAGVAGIDLVVLVVAADEGVMPQTREHLEILKFLGVKTGIIAITKIDRVDEELIEIVKEEIFDELKSTVFENAPYVLVDSVSHKGVEELKSQIIVTLKEQEMRDIRGAFRLPIDQVFTVKGQGTVVRGTVYEGAVSEGQVLTILPKGLSVRVRQIQVHHQLVQNVFAGQRAALNLSGVTKEELERGDVLVSSEHFIVTKTIDVAMQVVSDLDYIVKQRMPIKCHIGTAEVMGRIVFFDRNSIETENDEVLCQLRLDEEIVTKRGDRFILRRPTPKETIGGGWVIEPRGEKYKFGYRTIEQMEQKKIGTAKERITAALVEGKCLALSELITMTSLSEESILTELTGEEFVLISKKEYTLQSIIETLLEEFIDKISYYHSQYPMKTGVNKAELFHPLQKEFPKALLEYVLDSGVKRNQLLKKGQFVSLSTFIPHVPKNWQKRTENVLVKMQQDKYQVYYVIDYFKNEGIPDYLINDIKHFLEEEGKIVSLDEQYYWHGDIFKVAVQRLKTETKSEFDIGEAKQILGLSRKLMIPFLEKLDQLRLTKRADNKRVWI
ncbi:selenocysteine-specific translation elongation factor [Niallia endozanthoxylica]|uniref:Selenocysteine-specific elongation factor n=1 Tax=Niallia endozanthoxylica TaxID=2036016 RepID=A0A5J5HX04_9BACI|nr:selenocysteine-specific translation elongation factor [Niallia endozanthoxylica]KAA9025694.1 selenocysteine-specific translation elongation factor [Niallia endozanthoxylica]